jgi:hypothetical protein
MGHVVPPRDSQRRAEGFPVDLESILFNQSSASCQLTVRNVLDPCLVPLPLSVRNWFKKSVAPLSLKVEGVVGAELAREHAVGVTETSETPLAIGPLALGLGTNDNPFTFCRASKSSKVGLGVISGRAGSARVKSKRMAKAEIALKYFMITNVFAT